MTDIRTIYVWTFAAFGLGLFMGMLIEGWTFSTIPQTSGHCATNAEVFLQRINSKCGSMFVVECLDSDGLCVFSERCIYGNYCDYDYIPLEWCLA